MESRHHAARFLLWALLPWTCLHLGLHFADAILGARIRPGWGFAIGFLGVIGCSLWLSHRIRATTLGLRRAGIIVIGLFTVVVITICLVSPTEILAWATGGLLLLSTSLVGVCIGHEVQERAHLWPLIIVAVCFDLWSVTAPTGVSQNLIVSHEADAVSQFLLLSVPIPGLGLQAVLGIGDLVFSGLLIGATHTLALPWRLGLIGQWAGYGLCLMLLYLVQLPLPALVLVGPVWGIFMVGHVRPRPKEIMYAAVFIGVAYGVQLVVT
ncbi:MAG: hypothetical protein VX589_18675 [Myxococcota bacterium]|nr:hypothetical protein [Myxococcota bacterium]